MRKQKEAKTLLWVLRTDLNLLDSAISTQEANSKIVDEFLGNLVKLRLEASDKDKTKVYRGELSQSTP